MFAVIKTGGKQLMVKKDDIIFVEKLEGQEGDKVYFTEVVMIDDKIGTPILKGAVVIGKIMKQGKGKKIKVIRYHPKKNVNKIYGHRQPYTKVQISDISLSWIWKAVPHEDKKIAKKVLKESKVAIKKEEKENKEAN